MGEEGWKAEAVGDLSRFSKVFLPDWPMFNNLLGKVCACTYVEMPVAVAATRDEVGTEIGISV